MVLIRRFETKIDVLYRQGRVRGPAHLGMGQEAVAVGAAAALRAGDRSIGTYRGHAHALARGAPPEAVLRELLGRVGGICHGKGGSMHITDVEHGYFGSYAIIGAHLPIACGMAWADQVNENGAVTVSSENLAEAAGVNSAKVRKDLSYLGSYGTRGVGYDVAYLIHQVRRELGLTQHWPIVIAGNVATAEGAGGDFMMLILEGRVEVVKQDRWNRPQVIAVVGHNSQVSVLRKVPFQESDADKNTVTTWSPLDLADVNADGQTEVILEGDAYEDHWIEVAAMKDGAFRTIFSGLGYYL
jgi:hypothetical protein